MPSHSSVYMGISVTGRTRCETCGSIFKALLGDMVGIKHGQTGMYMERQRVILGQA